MIRNESSWNNIFMTLKNSINTIKTYHFFYHTMIIFIFNEPNITPADNRKKISISVV